MIILCPKCETQYRFDDSLSEGDGVWVRCSRCQNVFFQPRLADHRLGESDEVASVRISDARRDPDARFPPGNGNGEKPDAKNPLFPPPAENPLTESEPVVDFASDSLSAVPDRDVKPDDLSALGREDVTEEEQKEKIEKSPQLPGKRRRWGRIILTSIALLVFVALVAGAVVLFLRPEIRSSVLREASPYLKGIPVLENLVPDEKAEAKALYEALLIKDLRQRTVTNIIVGSLHVIEGMVVNQSAYPVSGIKMRLVVADPYDVVLGQKIVYCGNILTDEELGAMTEAEIQRELSISQGSDFPGERVLPKGEIPFMIVFMPEQTGALKTSVTIAGAERAL
ncbi:MAG: zinc-ribbon domain-containing protein [Syntrophales bacterium]